MIPGISTGGGGFSGGASGDTVSARNDWGDFGPTGAPATLTFGGRGNGITGWQIAAILAALALVYSIAKKRKG